MSVHDLFGQTVQIAKPSRQDINHRGKDSLDQYFTPEWAAERLVENLFPDLTPADFVIEPSCGKGAFLKAIPTEVPALGIEIDPVLAAEAAESSGRQVLCGDFRTIDLPANPTVMVGNPPFDAKAIDQFIARAKDILPDNGRCGLILPAYVLQYPTRIVRWNQDWTLQQWMIPRELFVDLIKPLVFCMLRKEKVKILHGFLLQEEALDFRRYDAKAKLLLVKGKKRQSVWAALVAQALEANGSQAKLETLYRSIAPKSPRSNNFMKEKVRQTLYRNNGKLFRQTYEGEWSLIGLAS